MNPSVLITIPCFNEELILKKNVEELFFFCREHLSDYDWNLLIADNHSNDETAEIGQELSKKYDRIHYYYLCEKGRGNILRTCWMEHSADIYAYMDADLATKLRHLPSLLKAVDKGADIAMGTRLIPGARVIARTVSRELASRGYNLFLKLLFRVRFHDAQCGFKAVSRRVRDTILPLTQDDHWFFDSETLILSERKQYLVKEITVTWEDHQGRESKVKFFKDILYFLRQMARLRWRLTADKEIRSFLNV